MKVSCALAYIAFNVSMTLSLQSSSSALRETIIKEDATVMEIGMEAKKLQLLGLELEEETCSSLHCCGYMTARS